MNSTRYRGNTSALTSHSRCPIIRFAVRPTRERIEKDKKKKNWNEIEIARTPLPSKTVTGSDRIVRRTRVGPHVGFPKGARWQNTGAGHGPRIAMRDLEQ